MSSYKKTRYINVYTKEVNVRGKVEKHIYTRFRFNDKVINYKNLTKKFDIKDARKAEKFIEDVIVENLKKGIDPFHKNFTLADEKNSGRLIEELWEEYKKIELKNLREISKVQYERFYNRYLKDAFEHKCITQITKQELLSVWSKLDGFSEAYRSKFKIIMGYFYEVAEEENLIDNNFIKHRQFKVGKHKTNKIPLEYRTSQDFITMAQYIYDASHKYETKKQKLKVELPLFVLLNLMTGHRYGELCELRVSNLDLKNKRLVSYTDITKTQIISAFPYPQELDEYFQKFKGIKDDRKLFPNIIGPSYGKIFTRLIRDINYAHKLKDENVFKITAHEMRNLLLSSMSHLGYDSDEVDKACLDHNANTVKSTYWSTHYKKKVELYNVYWENLRSHNIPQVDFTRVKRRWIGKIQKILLDIDNNLYSIEELKDLTLDKNKFVVKAAYRALEKKGAIPTNNFEPKLI
ncbi:phage integrase family protein [Malaciobacter marinus]|uniref:Phage integrase family protein n=1 Tax=Malaciobacter marinus TaxID=505249 RepID=A0AB36ZTB7_9BACT|nr:tyrosine-type recombinase/integrase [Malaciobacter marinus]PPK57329.1 phage integrase family protein [Malaciobacter marinus]